jgi:hypothetical protein
MRYLLLASAALFISPIGNAQKLWRQTHYSIYDISDPNFTNPKDSIVYFYNPFNASLSAWDPVNRFWFDPFKDHFLYDSAVSYVSQGGPTWVKDKLETQTMDTKGNITKRNKFLTSYPGPKYRDSESEDYTFDANGDLQTYVRTQWYYAQWNNLSRESYTYNAGSLISILADTAYVSGPWQNNRKHTYSYTNGKLSEEIMEQWQNSNWVPKSRTLYTYDVNSRIAIKTLQTWNAAGSIWEHYTRNAYAYDANGNCIGDTTHVWWPSTSSWSDSRRRIYQYNTNNNPTSAIVQSPAVSVPSPAWKNDQKHEYTYNAANLIARDEMMFWDDLQNQWVNSQYSLRWNYYYEQFTVGVQDATKPENNLTLYPNPAITQLRINATWQHAQPFTVAMLDMSGRVLSQWSETVSKTYNANIPVMDMPAGNYTILLNNGEEKITGRFSVLK